MRVCVPACVFVRASVVVGARECVQLLLWALVCVFVRMSSCINEFL